EGDRFRAEQSHRRRNGYSAQLQAREYLDVGGDAPEEMLRDRPQDDGVGLEAILVPVIVRLLAGAKLEVTGEVTTFHDHLGQGIALDSAFNQWGFGWHWLLAGCLMAKPESSRSLPSAPP